MLKTPTIPLAARLRPKTLDAFIGQKHLLSPGKLLWQAIQTGNPHSMLLWGPPGTGKTTLARLFTKNEKIAFINLSAVTCGIKDIRAAIEEAIGNQENKNQKTILFIDEVHRFNKNQQDVFLPFIEDGTFIFIGATTENPSFEINNALLSRCQTYILHALTESDILTIIDKAIVFLEKDTDYTNATQIDFDPVLRQKLAQASDGDARQILNMLEIALSLAPIKDFTVTITEETLKQSITDIQMRFDKKGDLFYDQISALHKSVRGSSPDAALYWLARMLEEGVDPLYIARRVVRMASEDIGNADPKAIEIALNAWDVQKCLGSPTVKYTVFLAISFGL